MTAAIHPAEDGLSNRIEEALARQRPFANSAYIKKQFRAAYKRRLIKISDAIPAAGDLVQALDRVEGGHLADRILSDTCVRTVIDHSRRRVLMGSASAHHLAPAALCEEVLRKTASFAWTGEGLGPLNVSKDPRLGSASYQPWIWCDSRPVGDPFGNAYKWLIEAHYGGIPMPADGSVVESLRIAARLLEKLVPRSGPSVLGHTQTIAVIPAAGVWQRMQSSSQYLLGGNIFLSELVMDKPWLLAELLYHESIHQKLYDFRHGHTVLKEDAILDPDSIPASEVIVTSPWNYPDNQWDTHRALAAFHVYVHITYLCSQADKKAAALECEFGPRAGMTSTEDALNRACYLGGRLREPGCWAELGEAGRRLVSWLQSILDAMDLGPPPAGASLHLYLNRYEREAARVLKRPIPAEEAYQAHLLQGDELAIMTDLITRMGRPEKAEELRSAVTRISGPESPLARFARTRFLIAAAVRECSHDGYELPRAAGLDAEQVIRRMVERSSRLLALSREIDELEGNSAHELLLANRRAAGG